MRCALCAVLIRNSPPQPAGLPDLHSFTRQEARHFHLNGTPESELEGVKFSLDGGLYDAPTGLSVYVSHPKPSYAAGGTLRPRMCVLACPRPFHLGHPARAVCDPVPPFFFQDRDRHVPEAHR